MSKLSHNIAIKLPELADILSASLVLNKSPEDLDISGVNTLAKAKQTDLSFFINKAYKQDLINSKAGVILISPKYADWVQHSAVLIVDNPHLAFAKILNTLKTLSSNDSTKLGIHPTAIIGKNSEIAESSYIGPYVVIGDNVKICENVVIESGCHIGNNTSIDKGTCLYSRVSIYSNVKIGQNCIIHSGAVIGSDGFSFAPTADRTWYKVEQLGGVTIGNNVEIGANTTIDCGALEDTLISDGVKLDNQIQVGHNVIIGKNCAFAAKVAIAGSTKIGDNCAVGGASVISGHLTICDNVNLAGTSVTAKSIDEPGVYASGTGSVLPFKKWRRLSVNFENSDKYISRLKELEKKL